MAVVAADTADHLECPASGLLQRSDSDATAFSSAYSQISPSDTATLESTAQSYSHHSHTVHKSKSQFLSSVQPSTLDYLPVPTSAGARKGSSISKHSHHSSQSWKLEFRGMVKLVNWMATKKDSKAAATHKQPSSPRISKYPLKPPMLSPVKRGVSLAEALQLPVSPARTSVDHQRVQLSDPPLRTPFVPSPDIPNNPLPALLTATSPEGSRQSNDAIRTHAGKSMPFPKTTTEIALQMLLPSPPEFQLQNVPTGVQVAQPMSELMTIQMTHSSSSPPKTVEPDVFDDVPSLGYPISHSPHYLEDDLPALPEDDEDVVRTQELRELQANRERRRRSRSIRLSETEGFLALTSSLALMTSSPTEVTHQGSVPLVSDDAIPEERAITPENLPPLPESPVLQQRDYMYDLDEDEMDENDYDFVRPLSPSSSFSHGHSGMGTRSDLGHYTTSPSQVWLSASNTPPRLRPKISMADRLRRSFMRTSPSTRLPTLNLLTTPPQPLDMRLLNKDRRMQATASRSTVNLTRRPSAASKARSRSRSRSRSVGGSLKRRRSGASRVSRKSSVKRGGARSGSIALSRVAGKSMEQLIQEYREGGPIGVPPVPPLPSGCYPGDSQGITLASMLTTPHTTQQEKPSAPQNTMDLGSLPGSPIQSPMLTTLSLPCSALGSATNLSCYGSGRGTPTSSIGLAAGKKNKLFRRKSGGAGGILSGKGISGNGSWSSAGWARSSDSITMEMALNFEQVSGPGIIGTTLVESPPADADPHPPSTWFNTTASGRPRKKNSKVTMLDTSPSALASADAQPSPTTTPASPSDIGHSRSSSASSFFGGGGLGRARTFSIKSSAPSQHQLDAGGSAMARKASLGAKLRPWIGLSMTPTPEGSPTPPVPPLPTSVRLVDRSPLVNTSTLPCTDEKDENGERTESPSPMVVDERASSLPSRVPRGSMGLTALAYTGKRGYLENSFPRRVTDPNPPMYIPQTEGDEDDDESPRNNRLLTSPSSPDVLTLGPHQRTSLYDPPQAGVASHAKSSSLGDLLESADPTTSTNTPTTENMPAPGAPRPARPVRPRLVHRPSTTSAQRWTIAVSDIPDDGEFLKELDRLRQSREARYAAARSRARAETRGRPRTPQNPELLAEGEAEPEDSALPADDLDDECGDEEDDFVDEPDSEEELVWMKARKVMLCVREILRTERSYKYNLCRVSDTEATNLPPLFLEHLPALIEASNTLSAGMEDDPSACGVSTAFLGVEDQLEAVLVSWCKVVGQVMLDLAEGGSGSGSGRTSFYRKGSGSKEKKDKDKGYLSMGEGTKTKEPKRSDTNGSSGSSGKVSGPTKPAKMKKTRRPATSPSVVPPPLAKKPTPPPPRPPSAGSNALLLSVQDVAIMPTQRVPRYVLLFKELLQQIPVTSPSRALVERALEGAQRIAEKCNAAQQHPELVASS